MTSQQQLICDNSTLANFIQWAQPISLFFAAAGWHQSSDTGQVNWSTISAVPGTNTYVYEVWQPNDGLTNFFAKIEYGNAGSTNSPTFRVSIGTGTNGAGTLTGFVSGPWNGCNVGSPSSSTQYECNFSGAPGRMHVMLFRQAANGSNQLFSIERSVNASGAYTSAHVTVIVVGYGGNSNAWSGVIQQTIVFGVGVAPIVSDRAGNNTTGGLAVRLVLCGRSGVSGAFQGALAFDSVAPYVGYWDYQLTGIGAGQQPDFAEGVTFQVTLYGATRTYMPSKAGSNSFGICGPENAPVCMFMRYD